MLAGSGSIRDCGQSTFGQREGSAQSADFVIDSRRGSNMTECVAELAELPQGMSAPTVRGGRGANAWPGSRSPD
jgi:hypothetical protein